MKMGMLLFRGLLGSLLAGATLFVVDVGQPAAWADVPGIDPTTYYEVTYATGATQARTIKAAKIVDLKTIGSQEFLIIEPQGLPGAAQGYISLNALRSILPVGYFGRPNE